MSLLVLESIGQHIDTIWKEKTENSEFSGKIQKVNKVIEESKNPEK